MFFGISKGRGNQDAYMVAPSFVIIVSPLPVTSILSIPRKY